MEGFAKCYNLKRQTKINTNMKWQIGLDLIHNASVIQWVHTYIFLHLHPFLHKHYVSNKSSELTHKVDLTSPMRFYLHMNTKQMLYADLPEDVV